MKNKLRILLLAGNTLRARAYAQKMAVLDNGDFEFSGLFCGFRMRSCRGAELDDQTRRYLTENGLLIPDMNISPEITFKDRGWNFDELETDDVNDDSVIDMLNASAADIIVFAGYGGQILKAPHFAGGRKYLHMHPGKLPIERGSTTLFYSILNKRNCTVTAFYMTEKIDAGTNILDKEYPVPYRGVNLDQWFDNVIRADCFGSALIAIKENKEVMPLSGEVPQEYYVIHPVLKHVALLSLKQAKN